MNFQHTEDRRMLADSLSRFLSEQYDFATRDKIARSATGFSEALWERFAELGVIGALFAEADGGFGGAGFDIAVVFECVGRALVTEPLVDALIVGQAISVGGNEKHKDYLASLIEGGSVAALAHDEPGSHYELSRVATHAVRGEKAGRSGWVLTGAKAVVQQGEEADFFLVSARTSGALDEQNGISLFVVPNDTPGLTVRGYGKIDGGRAAEIAFHEAYVADDALLGVQNAGYAILERSIGFGVLARCAEALGAMDVAKESTLEYLRTRKQFGVAIGTFQALQHRMADLLLEIEQARSAVINAAAAMENERSVRERALSAAKYTIGHIGSRVAEECIQLHGGIGMTWELPLAHYAKRLVMIDHQLGDEDHHLERYIALGKESKA